MYMDLTHCTISLHCIILCVCLWAQMDVMDVDLTHCTVSVHCIILCVFVGIDGCDGCGSDTLHCLCAFYNLVCVCGHRCCRDGHRL